MDIGTVKVFFADRHFGFIAAPARNRDFYFHRCAVRDSGADFAERLKEGARVEFKVGLRGGSGPHAKSECATIVRILD